MEKANAIWDAKKRCFADVTSGSKAAASRPGMQKLLDHAESGGTVVEWRIDRLGRSLVDGLNSVNTLWDADIGVQTFSDGIDRASSTGRLMLNMLATLAEYERELIVERVNASIAAVRQSGTRFRPPLSDPTLISQKLELELELELASQARAARKTAAQAATLVGWSRPALYRCQQSKGHFNRESVCMGHLENFASREFMLGAGGHLGC